jgi:CHAT domain-containing protein
MNWIWMPGARPRFDVILGIAAAAATLGLGELHATGTTPEGPIAQGRALIDAGRYQEAAALLEGAVRDYRRRGNHQQQVAAAVALGSALQSLGQYCSAAHHLKEALPLAQAMPGVPELIMQVEASLGHIYLYSRRWDTAEELLRSALIRARRLEDKRAEATVLHNLGSVLIAKATPTPQIYHRDTRGVILAMPHTPPGRAPYQDGLDLYHESACIAAELGDHILWLTILANEGRVLWLHGDPLSAHKIYRETWPHLASIPASREKAFVRLAYGHLAAQLAAQLPHEREILRHEATEAYHESLRDARAWQDERTETYACGFLAELALKVGRLEDAMRLAQEALFLAQKSGIEEARFQWLWLLGRILHAQADTERALTTYRAAVRTLDNLRSDFSLWLSVRGSGHSFREAVGGVYFELADLLLQRAAQASSLEAAHQDLVEARSTVELLKSVEVEDYFFEDDCANLFRAKVQTVEASVQGSAVIYIIALGERIELLVSLPSGLRQLRTPVGHQAFAEEVHRWRALLERPDSEGYLRPARTLYDWLIRPLEPMLESEGIETLVFVPDGALRTVPMAALHDGRQFLIERFAVAVSPGLSLMEPGRVPTRQLHLLLCGVSEGVQSFPALDFVPAELANVSTHFSHRILLDRTFSTSRFQQEMARGDYNVVHLASHGEFGSDARTTFVLTYDGKLTMDLLEHLILPRMLSENPIELLTLSACRTAAGDDRAALGVAVKSGARSALATLWYISDEAAQRIMSEFYANLKHDDSISKAEALRRAQCDLLRNPRLRHPSYWSPYLLIGNWL